jgi:uncharacterized surface anchored protein
MRRVFLGLVSVLAYTSLTFGVAAAATSGCDVVNTGPNSNNTCTVTNSNDLKVTCTNKADVVFVNNQDASSGSVTLQNNTNGGYAYSGNAVNTNSTTGKLNVSCGAKTAVAPTPAPTPTPTPSPTPSSSSSVSPAPAAAKSSQPAGGQGAAQAAALPNTGSNSLVATATIASVVLAVVAVGARVAFSAFQRF